MTSEVVSLEILLNLTLALAGGGRIALAAARRNYCAALIAS